MVARAGSYHDSFFFLFCFVFFELLSSRFVCSAKNVASNGDGLGHQRSIAAVWCRNKLAMRRQSELFHNRYEFDRGPRPLIKQSRSFDKCYIRIHNQQMPCRDMGVLAVVSFIAITC